MKKLLLTIILLLPSVAYPCSLNGRFAQIVSDIFGERWARTQTSYGLAVVDARSGRSLCEEFVSPDKNIYPASTIKTLIVFAALKLVEEGEISLEERVTIDQVNAAAECAHWDCSLYGPGKKRKVRELIWDTITISNNIATNQLTDLVGKKRINAIAKDLRLDLRINRKVYDDVNPEPDIQERNEATARGLVGLYQEIATGKKRYLRKDLREYLIKVLSNQKYNSSLNRHFPSQVTFYHKTGNTSQVTGDGGFFYHKGKIIVLVGLQDFNRYRVCNTSCYYRTGFWSLAEIGSRTYNLIQDLF